MIFRRQQPKRYSGREGLSSGGGGEDVGKLTRKHLNRGLPGRKQGTVRIQVAEMEQEGRQHTGTLGRLTVFGPASFADEVLYLASRIWNWLSLFLL